MAKETIGERIVRLRGAMSQTELANRIKAITGDGLSRAAISLWEIGATKSIKPENLLAACDVFEIDPWELVYGKARYQVKHKAPASPDSELTLGDKELWLLTMYSQIPAEARTEFKRLHPCPATGRATGPCPGYVIDHREALACGGVDAPHNMQWQTTADAKIKDRYERRGCRRRY